MRFCCARFAEALGNTLTIRFQYERQEGLDEYECYGPWVYMDGLAGSEHISYCPWCGRPTTVGVTEEDADGMWDWSSEDIGEARSEDDDGDDDADDGRTDGWMRAPDEDREERTTCASFAADLDDLVEDYRRRMAEREDRDR